MEFNSQQYWADRYACGGDSGYGSRNHLSKFKSRIVKTFLADHGCKYVAELGCGDGMQIEEMLPHFEQILLKSYTGFDISSPLIWQLREKFKCKVGVSFKTMVQLNEKFDATLSLDVIYHLVEDAVFEEYMNKLFDHSNKLVIIYSSNQTDNEGVAAWIKHREFTEWVKANKPEWKLVETIKNPWPYSKDMNPKKARNSSVSNFYIYVKEN